MKTTVIAVTALLFAAVFFHSTSPVYSCKCPSRNVKDRLCHSDFVAVVNVTGKDDSCDHDKCFSITVLSVLKGSPSVSMIQTPGSPANCGFAVGHHGVFVASGSVTGHVLHLNSCLNIFKKVQSIEGPVVLEHKELLKNCTV